MLPYFRRHGWSVHPRAVPGIGAAEGWDGRIAPGWEAVIEQETGELLFCDVLHFVGRAVWGAHVVPGSYAGEQREKMKERYMAAKFPGSLAANRNKVAFGADGSPGKGARRSVFRPNGPVSSTIYPEILPWRQRAPYVPQLPWLEPGAGLLSGALSIVCGEMSTSASRNRQGWIITLPFKPETLSVPIATTSMQQSSIARRMNAAAAHAAAAIAEEERVKVAQRLEVWREEWCVY